MQSDRRLIEQLNVAVEHRTEIGKALGMLMERFDLSDDGGFRLPLPLLADQNCKLYDIAAEMVETRETPGDQGAQTA